MIKACERMAKSLKYDHIEGRTGHMFIIDDIMKIHMLQSVPYRIVFSAPDLQMKKRSTPYDPPRQAAGENIPDSK